MQVIELDDLTPRAATVASSQVSPIPRISFLTMPLQFVLGRPVPFLKPGLKLAACKYLSRCDAFQKILYRNTYIVVHVG